ncbi:MAG: methyltransferase domain-containing protein [Myxococcales bacterium]|nr:methyltransferase domain-containing protein [Myxococcales bacterium]
MSGAARVRIEALSWRGHGVAGPVLVPGTDVGELVDVERVPGERQARLVQVVEASPARVDPGCGQAADCPGCPLRHLAPERQQTIKIEAHGATLARLAGVTGLPVAVVPGPPADGHRARARARPVEVGGRTRLGMAGLPGRGGISLVDCPAQTPGSRALLAAVEALAPALDQVEVDGGPDGGQVILTGPPAEAARVAAALPEAVTVLGVVLGPRGPSRPTWLRGPRAGVIVVDGDTLQVTAPAWRPQSPASLAALRVAVVAEVAAPGASVLEIGCGVGTLSLPVARRVASLVGVDLERAATLDAAANAARAGLANARFRVGDGAHAVRRLVAGGARFDRAILHAMRRPFGPELLPRLPLLGVREALYLAPSAAGLARDLAAGGALRPTRLAVLDQLPGTVHLLTLCALAAAD